ncbi:MAG: hypothetical protein R3F22_04795 [Lysobacteraceae bacterium]
MNTMIMSGNWRPWRLTMWSAAALLLCLPWAAMQLYPEAGVNWTAFDFMVFGTMLLVAGAAVEVAVRMSGNGAYRLAVVIAVGAAFLQFWVNAAVGIIGNEDNPANLMFFGVLAIGFVGALLVKLHATGMAHVLTVVAVAELIAGVIGWSMGYREALIISMVLGGAWVASAQLFRKAG